MASNQDSKQIDAVNPKKTVAPLADNVFASGVPETAGDAPAVEAEKPGLPGPPTLTEKQKTVVESLRSLQGKHQEYESSYMKELNQLKLKYLKLFKPLYEQRCSVITEAPTGEDETGGTPKLPGFWLTAMKNHRALEELIAEHDEPVLQHLKDIRSEWLDEVEQTSFRLVFEFGANPFFEHDNLVKTYNLEKDDDGDGVLMSTVGTKIKWNPGQDITKVTVTKKQRNSKTKVTRVVTTTQVVDSFFDFFNSYDFPTPDQFSRMEEDEAREIEDDVQTEFDIGCIIREKILPRALCWYMGEEYDDWSEDDDSDEDDDHDEDDSEEDSDDDRHPHLAYGGKLR